jgi:alanine dehydrogenase
MPDVMLLGRSDVDALLGIEACIAAVEAAFGALGRSEVPPPGVLGVHAAGGGFHIKAALFSSAAGRYFAAKTNANFPENPHRFGLPTIQGLVLLFDADSGRPLAVMDSIALTALRTAAATALAARHLARPDSRIVTICGCGAQAMAQLKALCAVLPLRRAHVVDTDAGRAQAFAVRAAADTGIAVETAADLRRAARASDVVVTCTPSRRALLGPADIAPGTFVAGVGADNPEKQELEPALLALGTLVVDVLDQCAVMGDLHHALESGALTRADVHADLGSIVAGRACGRRTADEVTIFDSTGMALQDAAAAAAVYEKAGASDVRRWAPA